MRDIAEHGPRLWPHGDAIRETGEAFLDCTLPKAEWTHEAHISTTCWLILERSDLQPERDLPGLIRRYNESVGGVNSDSEGYHETITRAYLRGVRWFLAGTDTKRPLHLVVSDLLSSPVGSRDWPLRFWSRDRLMSSAARLGYVEPDLGPLP